MSSVLIFIFTGGGSDGNRRGLLANQFTLEGPVKSDIFNGGRTVSSSNAGGWASQIWVPDTVQAAGRNLSAWDLASFGHKIVIDGNPIPKDGIDICFTIGTEVRKGVETQFAGRITATAYQCYTGDSTTATASPDATASFAISSEERIAGYCGNLLVQPTSWDGDCDIYVVLSLEVTDSIGIGYAFCTYGMAWDT